MKFLTKDELATVCGSRELVRRIYKLALVTITLLDVNNRLSMDVVLEQLTKDSYSLLCFEKLEGKLLLSACLNILRSFARPALNHFISTLQK